MLIAKAFFGLPSPAEPLVFEMNEVASPFYEAYSASDIVGPGGKPESNLGYLRRRAGNCRTSLHPHFDGCAIPKNGCHLQRRK